MSEYYHFYNNTLRTMSPNQVKLVRAPSGHILRFSLTDDALKLEPQTGDYTSFYCEFRQGDMTAQLFSRRTDKTPIHPDFRAGQFLRVTVPYFNPNSFIADWLINQATGMATYGEEYLYYRNLRYTPIEAALFTGCGRILSELDYMPHYVDETTGNNIVWAHFMRQRY